MPIYEYECQACHHEFETIQKISESPLTECPQCRENELRKKVSAAAFRLKGKGWYETDFKSGNKKNVHGDEGGSSSKSASESSTKNESKPNEPKSQASKNSTAEKSSVSKASD